MAVEGFPVATFLGTGRDPVSLWCIRRHLYRIRPDVLHMNDPHALTSAGLASLGLAIPARVAARHSCFPIHYAARYGQLCDRVICVIGAVAEVCRRDGIPAEMLRIVHCGSDERMLCSGSRQRGRDFLGLSDDQPLLLTVALLNQCKGHAFLLDALPKVIRRHPRVCLALAGNGETAAVLKAQARRLGIDAHVRFLGYRHDVPDLLLAADLFVMPSLMEGFCSVLIEAMLAGVPIITTAVGGIPEVVGSDGSAPDPVAWTVPAGDSKALSAAILEALASPQNRLERGLRGKQRALAQFTANRMVESTLEVYREVLLCETAG
jgi:glycosyltransferase involved in cell wall biosynthesis